MKTNILFIDDEEINLIITKSLIEKNIPNATCNIVGSGKEALEIIKKDNNYDIIVIDMVMPEMDGFQTAKAITKYYLKNNITKPHLISYTSLNNDAQEKALKSGITDYINRANKEELIKVIQKWIIFEEVLKEYNSTKENF